MSEEEKEKECPRHKSHFEKCICGTIHEVYRMWPLKGKWSLEEWERSEREKDVSTFTERGSTSCCCGYRKIPKFGR